MKWRCNISVGLSYIVIQEKREVKMEGKFKVGDIITANKAKGKEDQYAIEELGDGPFEYRVTRLNDYRKMWVSGEGMELVGTAADKKISVFTSNEIKKEDVINHPNHYNQYSFEVLDIIKEVTSESYKAYAIGNILKYILRHQHKGKPLEDLKKAQFYLNDLIEKLEQGAADGK